MPGRPRLVHVDTERGWRGGQVQLEVFLRRTGDAFEHHLVVPLGSPWLDRTPPGVELHRLPLWGRRVGRRDLRDRLHSLAPQAVGVHTAHALALMEGPWPQVVHRRVDFLPSRWALRRLRRAARVLAVSGAVAELLRVRGVERVRVVHDGVDHDVPAAATPARPRLLSVGALVPHKDHATLLRAMVHVPVPLDIAGDGPLRPRLQRRIRCLGLEERVRLLGSVDDVPLRLMEASALVHPSKEEGLGQVVLEAMARRVPVVASRAGGLPEAVGADGLMVPVRDPVALAVALNHVLSEGERFRHHLATAHPARSKRFGLDRMVSATAAAYWEAAG